MKEYRIITTDGYERSAPLHELLADLEVGFTIRIKPKHILSVYDKEGEHFAQIFPVY